MNDILSLAPYFRNGLLYFPERTIQALIEVGLDPYTARRAMQGLSLDDTSSLNTLNQTVDALLAQVDSSSPFFSALASDEAYFVLTGKPLSA
ncbi:MAG TPA: hypothetical protein VKY59_13250 [Spirillospora sp.]|nr:hypothetical protein [Spirillospora sp.]